MSTFYACIGLVDNVPGSRALSPASVVDTSAAFDLRVENEMASIRRVATDDMSSTLVVSKTLVDGEMYNRRSKRCIENERVLELFVPYWWLLLRCRVQLYWDPI